MVVDGGLDAGQPGQGLGQQGPLEHGERVGEPLPVGLGLPAGRLRLGPRVLGLLPAAQEFLLVGAPVGGVEDGRADEQRIALAPVLDGGGDQHREPGALGRPHLQGDSAQLALHAQQGREVRLVVELAAHGEQVDEAPPADDVLAVQAQPVQQRGVDLGDGAVHQGRQIAAGRRLVEFLGAVLQQRAERRVRVRPSPVAAGGVGSLARAAHHWRFRRKSRRARAVASGALSCGQCPVASRVTRREPGIAPCT